MRVVHLAIISLIFSLISCSNENKNKLTILFDRADGMQVGSKVYLKGLQAGEVTHLKLFRDSVLADIKLTMKIPEGSTFLTQSSFLEPVGIIVKPSRSTTFLTFKDTCRGQYIPQRTIIEMIHNAIIKDSMINDSLEQQKIQHSLNKIGEGIKELVEAAKDTAQSN